MFLLAKGKNIGAVLADALREPQNINEFPVSLSIGKKSTWILDHEARKAFEMCEPLNYNNTKIFLV